jgi:hypothetical protein
MTVQWAAWPYVVYGCVFGGVLLAFYGWLFHGLIKSGRQQEKYFDEYKERKKAFIQSLDDRQTAILKGYSNASQTEVMMTMEKRIYELEQIIRNQQDDWK